MEKNPDGAYTEELQVSVNGQKPQKFDVEIPEKETEETEAEPEQEVNEAEQRQKELKEIIEEYNQQKQDPDYYYLPDSWNGQVLQWQKPGETTGTFLAALALFAAVVLMLKKAREQQENGEALTISGNGYTYTENGEAMRVQFIFDGKPDEQTREILKRNGFRWAPSQGAWQRQLTQNGKYAAAEVRKILDAKTVSA